MRYAKDGIEGLLSAANEDDVTEHVHLELEAVFIA